MAHKSRVHVGFPLPLRRGAAAYVEEFILAKHVELTTWIAENAKNVVKLERIPISEPRSIPRLIYVGYEVRFRSARDHALFKMYFGEFIIPTKKRNYKALFRAHDRRVKGRTIVLERRENIDLFKGIIARDEVPYYRRGKTFYFKSITHTRFLKIKADQLEGDD